MSVAIEGLVYCWKKNLDYAPKLVSDLTEEQMAWQPNQSGLPANHAAWVLSHLNVYIPIIESLIQGQAFDDPKPHKFGMTSKPERDRSLYASKQELVDTFVAGHHNVLRLLEGASDAILEQEVALARWKELMPKVGIALPYLMLNHENNHLGQLSAWRRVQGLPSV